MTIINFLCVINKNENNMQNSNIKIITKKEKKRNLKNKTFILIIKVN